MYKMFRAQYKATGKVQYSYMNIERQTGAITITITTANHKRGGQGWGRTSKVCLL